MTDTGSAGASAMQVDTDLVRQLAQLLDQTNLTEIEVEDGDRRVRVARKPAQVSASMAAPQMMPAPAPAPMAAHTAPATPALAPTDHPGTIRSPMVGTAYLSASPGAKVFVTEGQEVQAGETLLIVEAMKVMNPIVSPRSGRITRILIDNAQPVEFDQPLVVVE